MNDVQKEESAIIIVLKSIQGLPFPIGKTSLFNFLMGDEYASTIEKHNLQKHPFFGVFSAEPARNIKILITKAEREKLIEQKGKAIGLTKRGIESVRENKIVEKIKIEKKIAEITEKDKEEFKEYKDFLEGLNDQQKKAVICDNPHIACIAGAGSGKTTVLAKRIEHLVKHKKVDPKKILAITFTRRARLNMFEKVSHVSKEIQIHTFNSFCEKLLQIHEKLIYAKPTRIISFAEKNAAVHAGLKLLNISPVEIIKEYHSDSKNKTEKQLFGSFVQDCFGIIDYYSNNLRSVPPFYEDVKDMKNRALAEKIYMLVKYIQGYMSKHGLRDFSDQLKDALTLMQENPKVRPNFEHILIDEYQDINTIQIALMKSLNPTNLFCVGDPRQAIYGWRGSKMEFIQQFQETYPDAVEIFLTKNYRSGAAIVNLGNIVIEPMGQPFLEAHKEVAEIKIKQYEDSNHEAMGIAREIQKSEESKEKIFVITRTNKQLEEIASVFRELNIPFVIKNDDTQKVEILPFGAVVLATAHCVKGLEAEEVFVAGCNSKYFPCYVSEHKILDLVKSQYDKYEEELRILYVAITRAKKRLHISYTGKKISPFLKEIQIKKQKSTHIIGNEQLRMWRDEMATQLRIPGFLILSNEEITAICEQHPNNIEDLKSIITPNKAYRYGERILALLR
jgi:superfamily I DNA/RNA helicase